MRANFPPICAAEFPCKGLIQIARRQGLTSAARSLRRRGNQPLQSLRGLTIYEHLLLVGEKPLHAAALAGMNAQRHTVPGFKGGARPAAARKHRWGRSLDKPGHWLAPAVAR